MSIKKTSLVSTVLLFSLVFTSCVQTTSAKKYPNTTTNYETFNSITDSNSSKNNISTITPTKKEKITIVASLFPQYDFARQIVGDRANVSLLLPPGVESHSYDPTPADIININKSDLFIYTGKYGESWTDKVIRSLDNKNLNILDVSKNVRLLKEDDDHYDDYDDYYDDDDYYRHDHKYDPHIWTDPNNAIIMVDNILNDLLLIDPKNGDFYTQNANKYKLELQSLDKEIRNVVRNGRRDEIFFGGKNPFTYFLERYDIDHESAYESCSTQGDPSPRTISHIISEMREDRVPVIYYEELANPKVAKSISDATGAEMLLFHSAHNLSKKDFESGVTYLSIMKQNLQNLKKGLAW